MKLGAPRFALALVFFACVAAAPPEPTIPGTVTRIVDGDTLEVLIAPWPRWQHLVYVRVAGIDAPETHEAVCPEELELGKEARELVAAVLFPTRVIYVQDLVPGTDVVARVILPDGEELASILLKAELAKPYDGEGPRPNWCPEDEIKQEASS